MYLIAMLPPSNIRRDILDLQISLFRGCGDPAALALPPHVPIAFFEALPEQPGGIIQQCTFKSGGYLRNPPWVLLELNPRQELERLRTFMHEANAPEWYPTGRGIPLSRSEERQLIPTDSPPVLGWKTSHLICLELTPEESQRWWEQLEYSEIWRVKLKRKIE